MPRARMIFVKIGMQVPQRTVIGAMFCPAIEPLLVGAPVRPIHFSMEFPVRSVITRMSTIIVMG